MSAPNKIVAAMAAVIIIESASIFGIAISTLNAPVQPMHAANQVDRSQFDECIAGWDKTIAAMNANTARLNQITGGAK